MSDALFGPLRIWQEETGPRQSLPVPSCTSLLQQLAFDEVLRPSLHLREAFEPLSLAWYQEIERLRYHRHGRWIPNLLDFGKYRGERLLGLGTSLGTDLVNFAACGVEVLVASPIAEQLAFVRHNFDLRRLPGIFLHASPRALPIESTSVDIVFVNGLFHETQDSARVVEETYRVLKPGGKLVAIVPARQEINFLANIVKRFRRSRSTPETVRHDLPLPMASAFDRRSLSHLLARFQEGQIYRRHLRRADVPHLCRWLPLGMMERFTGRLLVFKGFKPVSAGRAESVAA